MPEPKTAQRQHNERAQPLKPPPQADTTMHDQNPIRSEPNGDSIMGFFRKLLPKSMDTGDLIIMLLLLLMANDCEENKNNALLTLALYFFL